MFLSIFFLCFSNIFFLEQFASEEEQIDDVVLRQGDMIQYLKHQKTALSERILDLTEKLKRLENGANSTVQV